MTHVRPVILSCLLPVLALILAVMAFAWMGYDYSRFSHIPIGDNRDPLLMAYYLEQSYENLAHRPLHLGYSRIFYNPDDPNTFGMTNAPYGLALFMAPIYILSGHNAIFTLNVSVLLTFALTAWMGALWLRYVLQAPVWCSWIMGLVLAFLPWRFLEIPRVELLSMQWFFLCAYALHRFLDAPQQRRWPILLAVAFWLNFFTGTYLAFFFLLYALVLILMRLYTGTIHLPRHTLFTFMMAGVVFALVSIPLLGFRLQQGGTLQGHPFAEIQFLSARPLNWIQGASFLYYNLNGFEVEEKALFIGFVPILLMAMGWQWRSDQLLIRFAAILVVLGVVLSFGPTVTLSEGVVIPTPYLLLMQIPGFGSMRIISRYAVLAYVGGAILMTYALMQLRQRLSRPAAGVFLSLITLLLIIELIPYNGRFQGRADASYRLLNREEAAEPLGLSQPAPFVPEALNAWLAALPPETPLFNYPPDKAHQYEYVFNILFHHQPLLGGESSYNPDWYEQQDWMRFPSLSTLMLMQDHNVQYALIYNQWLTEEERSQFMSRLKTYSGWLVYEQTIDNVGIYRLTPPPPLTEFTFDFDEIVRGEGWHTPELTSDGHSFAWTSHETFTLNLPVLHAETSYQITIGLWGGEATPETNKNLNMSVNGHSIPLRYDPVNHTLSALIEAGIIGEDPATLMWTTVPPHSPQALNTGGDSRRLGLAFDFVILTPFVITSE